MKLPRRRFLHLAAGAATLPVVLGSARADTYPSRPVRIIVGFPPGTATDIDARLIAQSLSARLGQQVIVDNRPGAASNIAAEAVVRAAPDGYTLLAMTISNAVNATLYQGLNFDIVRDIVPIAGTMRTATVLVVNPQVPAKTLPEFIAYAKANPGKINCATAGVGTGTHVAGELFSMLAGVDLVYVPYRASFMPDLLGGQVQASFIVIPQAIGYIRDGKLRALAVTGTTRSEALPDVSTVGEFVPGYAAIIWHGIGAPKGTPADIIDKLNKAINAAIADPTIMTQFASLGGEPMPLTPAGFGTFIAEEIDKWGKVVRTANIKVE
jgi:tripartite-type tricarboxylate transporter receptor subunit TctC